MKVFLLAVSFSIAALSAAQAKCAFARGYLFYPDQNDSVTYKPITDALGCSFNFQGGGGKWTLTSASVGSPAKNGALVQTGAFNFTYKPKKGFKGQDIYALKICGTGPSGAGCSTVIYETTVE